VSTPPQSVVAAAAVAVDAAAADAVAAVAATAAAAAAAATAAAVAAAADAGKAQSTSTLEAWSSDHVSSLERVSASTRQQASPERATFKEGRTSVPELPG
jgi:hypothetical protein